MIRAAVVGVRKKTKKYLALTKCQSGGICHVDAIELRESEGESIGRQNNGLK